MGRKPTPTKTLQARGSWRANGRADTDGPLYPVGEPGCPSWLCAEAKAEWRRIVPQLLTAGVLSEANRAALVSYCICWGRLHEAETHVKQSGAVLTSAKTGVEYQSPWLSIANNARMDLVRLACEFGLTPSSAGKVKVAAVEEAKDDGKGKGRFFKTVG